MVTPPFLFALFFVVGIACSKLLMSLSMISWLVWTVVHILKTQTWQEFKTRMALRLSENRWIVLVFSFVLLHILSLFWSDHISEGVDGIRVRLTFLIIPLLLIFTLQFSKKQSIAIITFLLYTFVVLVLVNVLRYQILLNKGEMLDIRQLSFFGSHIRFGVFLSFSALLAYYNWTEKAVSNGFFITYLGMVVLYTIYSQVLSAYGALLIVGSTMAYHYLKTINRVHFFWWAGLLSLVAVILFLLAVMGQPEQCPSFAQPNLAASYWGKKSVFPFQGADAKKQPLKRTLERYLCSKKRPFSERDIQSMSPMEVSHVEKGFTSVDQASGGILTKVEEVQFQLYEAKDPNGHSLLQRLVFWKAALVVISKNPWLGVGIGDVQEALNQQYQGQSRLKKENYRRPHNMFLTTFVAVGILGVFLLVLLFGLGFYRSITRKHALLFSFLCISLLSMMVEDSIETQAGISFFSFFLGLFLSDGDANPRLKID